MGMRPAAFSLVAPDATAALPVVPLGIESLGDEKHVLFAAPRASEADPVDAAAGIVADDVPVTVDDSAGTQLWTAKVAQYADLSIGRIAWLAVDLHEAHFFDPDTGEAIRGETAPEPVLVAADDALATR